MFRIAICDDETVVLEYFSQKLADTMGKYHVNYTISQFVSGEELLMDISQHGIFDVIFLDIELTRMDGIAAARQIRTQFPYTIMIFISNYSEYYKAAFDVQPFQFLDKPIDEGEFNDVFERVYRQITANAEQFSFCYNRVYYNLHLNEILYFESDRRLVYVVCSNRRYVYYGRLGEIEKYLLHCRTCFLRIHKSYLVNLDYVREYRKEQMTMENDDILPISHERRKQVREYYMQRLELKM